MKKVKITNIKDSNYTLNDGNKNYILNIEFYSKYQPKVDDVIYLSEKILKGITLYTFDDLYNDDNVSVDDIIKIVSSENEYYLQRQYG